MGLFEESRDKFRAQWEAEDEIRQAYAHLREHQGDAEDEALNVLLEYVRQPIHRCLVCSGLIHWVDCPTGGWWSHYIHPFGDHDTEAGGPILCETEEY